MSLHLEQDDKLWLNRYHTDRKPWIQYSTNIYLWNKTTDGKITACENYRK